MDEQRIELPEWLYDAMLREYIDEMKALENSPEAAYISVGWYGADLSFCLLVNEQDPKIKRRVSLEELCDQVDGWHSNGAIDQDHYGYITAIAEAMEKQAKRLRETLAGLEIRDD